MFDQRSQPLHNRCHLSIIPITIANRTSPSSSSNPLTSRLIRQIPTNHRHTLIDPCEEHSLLTFHKLLPVPSASLRQQKRTARSDLKALVNKLILIGVRNKTQVD